MKAAILVFCATLIVQSISFYFGYMYRDSQELSLIERRNIAIEYACSPEQNWKMMKFFCGSVK